MSLLVIGVIVFFAFAFLISIVVIAATALSSQVSQDLEWSDYQDDAYESDDDGFGSSKDYEEFYDG
jgi:hypothetical protein